MFQLELGHVALPCIVPDIKNQDIICHLHFVAWQVHVNGNYYK